MRITLLTLFPEYFGEPLQTSMLKRAQNQNAIEASVVDLRDFATDKRSTTDDRPFGGGPGMVMKIEPIYSALEKLKMLPDQRRPQLDRVILTSAKGKRFTQATAKVYSELEELIIICGHYEGVDERVAQHLIDEEVRIGDYVLTGGEPAALVMLDAVTRLIPGVLGNEFSNQDESHSEPGKLGFAQYTRPEEFKGWKVPEVLLGGDHKHIAQWREDQKRKEDE